MSVQTHIAVVGAGSGGYVAAIRAAQLGARVHSGRIAAARRCVPELGCIPSKPLLAVVDLDDRVKKADSMGLSLPRITWLRHS